MARKRGGRGEGGIFKRANGLWAAEVSNGYGPDGKRRRKTVYGATKAEVREKLAKLQHDVSRGLAGDADRLTVADYLAR